MGRAGRLAVPPTVTTAEAQAGGAALKTDIRSPKSVCETKAAGFESGSESLVGEAAQRHEAFRVSSESGTIRGSVEVYLTCCNAIGQLPIDSTD